MLEKGYIKADIYFCLIFVCLFVCLFVCWGVCLFVCLFVSLFFNFSNFPRLEAVGPKVDYNWAKCTPLIFTNNWEKNLASQDALKVGHHDFK